MLYFREEGGVVRNGFNFYKLSDDGSAGFIFKLINYTFWFRYSKITKVWTIG